MCATWSLARRPSRGPAEGGTPVTVLGSGFASAAEALGELWCRFNSTASRAAHVSESAAVCNTTQSAIGLVSVEVTLNGDAAAHTLTSDGVQFGFFDASLVTIGSVWPLGGPTAGGTRVVVRGSGFVDHGGVFCRFGTATTPSSIVPALLRSETELVCVSANVSAGGAVPVALTLNGDRAAFIESNASFEYYDPMSLSVSARAVALPRSESTSAPPQPSSASFFVTVVPLSSVRTAPL